MLLRDLRLNRIHCCLRLSNRDTWLEPGDHLIPMTGTTLVQVNTRPPCRQPELTIVRESETRRHYTDYRVVSPAITVGRYCPSQNVPIAGEVPLPQFVTQDRDTITVPLV